MATPTGTQGRPASRVTGILDFLLEYEQVVAQVRQVREGSKRPWWQSVEVLSLGTSLIISLASLLLAPIITARIQKDTKAFETDLARRDQLVAQERNAASSTDELVAVVLKGTDDRLSTVRGEFNSYPESLRDSIINASNAADDRWRTEQSRADFQIKLYFGEDTLVVRDWDRALTELNNYALCVEQLYLKQAGVAAAPTACAAHKTMSLQRAAALRQAMVGHFHSHHHSALDIAGAVDPSASFSHPAAQGATPP